MLAHKNSGPYTKHYCRKNGNVRTAGKAPQTHADHCGLCCADSMQVARSTSQAKTDGYSSIEQHYVYSEIADYRVANTHYEGDQEKGAQLECSVGRLTPEFSGRRLAAFTCNESTSGGPLE
jgi:hypothetical protein